MAVVCSLCQLEKPLIKAHLFPKQYFHELRQGSSKKHLVQTTVGTEVDVRFPQSGVYDDAILCGDCDNEKLGRYDRYAYELFPTMHDPTKLERVSDDLEIYRLGSVDCGKLGRYLIGTLWRLNATAHALGEHVDLGEKYANRFREILLNITDEGMRYVSCVAVLLLHNKYPRIMMAPFPNRFHGVNCYQIYIPPWKLFVRVDQRPFQDPFDQVELKHGVPGIALVTHEWSESEALLMKNFQDRVRRSKGLLPF